MLRTVSNKLAYSLGEVCVCGGGGGGGQISVHERQYKLDDTAYFYGYYHY